MDREAAFLLVVLLLQAVFVTAMILLVGRRFPRRLGVYRLVAPAALPVLLFGMASLAYLKSRAEAGLPPDMVSHAPIAHFAIGYGVLWLLGVLLATALAWWVRRK